MLSFAVTAVVAARDTYDDRTILNRKSLSLVVGEVSGLLGPREQPLALHRIVGIDQSLALTRVRHNNRLVLINPHRVLFDEYGFVDTGEFLATTLRIHGSYEASAVVSATSVQVSEHGYVALTTPGVTGEAVVIAAVSTSPSDAERKILFDFMSDGLVRYAIGESELGQFTGVNGKTLAKTSSQEERHEAAPGQMLMNVRSAADIQRSVMNTTNVLRARHLVVENGSIRLEGERPSQAMTIRSSKPFSRESPAGESLRQVLQEPPQPKRTIAMADTTSLSSKQDAARVSYDKEPRLDTASLPSNQVKGRTPPLPKKAAPTDIATQKARRTEGKSGSKSTPKAPNGSPLSRADRPQPTPWSSMPGGLPEWMKYLPKTETANENPAIP